MEPRPQPPSNPSNPDAASKRPRFGPFASSRPGASRSLARVAALSAAALVAAVTSFVAGRDRFAPQSTKEPLTKTPTSKLVENGGYVRWRTGAIDVVIDNSFSELAGDDLFGAALDAWRTSGAALPSVSTLAGSGRRVGYDPNGPNDNVVVFAREGWETAKNALAVTVLTFDNETGRIVDADLLVNGGDRHFQRFERDESAESDAPISIETGSSGDLAASKTNRYDLQSIVTHELGHFFGLGEDYDNAQGTMYTSTRPGEIHKRVLSPSDSDAVVALYPVDLPTAQASRGCARAQLAPGKPPSSSWLGLAAAGLGLMLLAASRRSRSVELRVRAPTARRRPRRVARFGGWLTVVGLGLFLSPPELEAAVDPPVSRGDADVEVVTASPRWVDGIVETELTYRVIACHVARCPEGDLRTVIAGGALGDVTQIVGPFAVPPQGARLRVGLRDHRSFYRMLDPTFQP